MFLTKRAHDYTISGQNALGWLLAIQGCCYGKTNGNPPEGELARREDQVVRSAGKTGLKSARSLIQPVQAFSCLGRSASPRRALVCHACRPPAPSAPHTLREHSRPASPRVL